ncbi:MAG: hypothetical protein RR996_01870 [Alistipes sp.]
MRLLLLLAVLVASGALSAQGAPPSPYRYMLITDGQKVYPQNVLATASEVNAADVQAKTVATSLDASKSKMGALETRIAAVEATIADLGKDSVWVLEGYINSIGVLSGMPEYSGKIDFVKVEVTDKSPTVKNFKLWARFNPAPISASQVAMKGSAVLTDAFVDLTYRTSYPTKVPNPIDPADTSAIYTFEAEYTSSAGFAKIVSLPGAPVGVGDYLPITGGLSVNGVNGATATITADNGTVLQFMGGVLVEAVPVVPVTAGGAK